MIGCKIYTNSSVLNRLKKISNRFRKAANTSSNTPDAKYDKATTLHNPKKLLLRKSYYCNVLLCLRGPLFAIISMYENNFSDRKKNDKDIENFYLNQNLL